MKFKRRFYRKFKYNRKRSFMFIFLFLLCLSFGLGYSLISTDLNIFGTTVLRDNRWSVYFDNIVELDGSVSPTVEPEITDNTTVSFSAKLKKPGEKFEFLIDVVNDGTIDAKIGNISMSPILTEEQQQFFSYEVTYESGVALDLNQALDAGSTETLKVSFKYLEQEDNSLYPDTDQTFNVVLTGEYVQGTGTPVNSPYLYDVLKKEAERGGLARKYTGAHHDSFNDEPRKNIYHWYASTDSEGNDVNAKNNLIFAGHCWKMIRTTDTGGIKILYNGVAVDNQCSTTTESTVIVDNSKLELKSSYWYGTDYIYDDLTHSFTLSGITEKKTWSASTGPNLVGKYTCKSSTLDTPCASLYYINTYNSSTTANAVKIYYSSSGRSIGTSSYYNPDYTNPLHVGYMYGDKNYESNKLTLKHSLNFNSGYQSFMLYDTLRTSYWYSDTVTYDSSTGKYSLVNPFQVSSSSDYPNLVGKYTLTSSTETLSDSSVKYIIGVNNSSMYYVNLYDGALLPSSSLKIGSGISDNGDGTYTLTNVENVSMTDWYSNYSYYKEKYICIDNATVCDDPRFIVSTTERTFSYVFAKNKILIAKNRNDLVLTDTLLVNVVDWYFNYSNYGDYKYTCKNTSSVCTEQNLSYIVSFLKTGYEYVDNYYFGSDVIWDGTNYTLVNPIGLENYNNMSQLSNHHYFCIEPGLKTCQSMGFLYYSAYLYVILNNGNTEDDIINGFFTENKYNSNAKAMIDQWYKYHLLDYTDYLEDTIYCCDRRIYDVNGWSKTGDITNEFFMRFGSVNEDLNCVNDIDKFSVNNSVAKLDYPIGLMTSLEMKLLNNNNLRKSIQTWLITPSLFRYPKVSGDSYYGVSVGFINSYGVVTSDTIYGDMSYNIRPSISLKPGTEYLSGDGSIENPYVVN